MAGRVILFGDLAERYEAERLLGERHPEVHVESANRSWDLVERACTGSFDVAVVLKGPIWEHQQRLEVVTALRRNEFHGRIVYAGAFLTEKHDALAAGADFCFDPEHHPVEEVARRALFKPRLAGDHPYLRHLFLGEWASIEPFGDELPEPAPELLFAATSCHPDDEFYSGLAAYTATYPKTHCLLVDDAEGGDTNVAALASGVQPFIVLADEGLQKVLQIGRRLLRESWMAHIATS
jgi:hypothetical protein